MNLNLFDKAGRWTEPSAEALAAITEPERAAVARIREAALTLDQANAAAQENVKAIKATQDEIAKLEKIIPKVTFIDLAKQQAAETQRRRAGL